MGIAGKFGNTFAANLHIPQSINQQRTVAHSSGKVNIAFLFIIVTAGVHADNPRPHTLAIILGIVLTGRVSLFYKVPRYSRFDNIGRCVSHGDRTPRSFAGQSHLYRSAAPSVQFALHGETYTEFATISSQQAATYVVTISTGFGYQNPQGFLLVGIGYFEQAGESISIAPSVFAYRFAKGIFCFITGHGTGKACHRIALRSHKGKGITRKLESGSLFGNHTTAGVALRQHCVAESHIAIAHIKVNLHNRSILSSCPRAIIPLGCRICISGKL